MISKRTWYRIISFVLLQYTQLEHLFVPFGTNKFINRPTFRPTAARSFDTEPWNEIKRIVVRSNVVTLWFKVGSTWCERIHLQYRAKEKTR